MARTFSTTNIAIWQDPDWRALPWSAQHLYKALWDHPGLSYAGVVDWRPAKLLGLAAGMTRPLLDANTACLRARHFIVVDEDTEECLVRSWVRFDGLMKNPRMAVSFANAYAAIGSNMLRAVAVDELIKLRAIEPKAAGWTKDRVLSLLDLPRQAAKELDLPTDPFRDGFAYELKIGHREASVTGSIDRSPSMSAQGSVTPKPTPYAKGSPEGSPTPAPAPAPAPAPPQATPQEASMSGGDPASGLAPAGPDGLDRFDEFWNAYGKKHDRAGCLKLWKAALKKRGVTADILIKAATIYVSQERQHNENGRYVMDPAKWLRNERWNDERPEPPTTSRPPGDGPNDWMRRRPPEFLERERRAAAERAATGEPDAARLPPGEGPDDWMRRRPTP